MVIHSITNDLAMPTLAEGFAEVVPCRFVVPASAPEPAPEIASGGGGGGGGGGGEDDARLAAATDDFSRALVYSFVVPS